MAAERRPTVYARRFSLLYALLGAAVAAAIVGLVVALAQGGGSGAKPADAWSSWQPTASGLGRAEQIARHVAPEYKLADGSELVGVITRHPEISANGQTLPLGYVGIKGTHGASDTIFTVSTPNTVMYSLCGLGPACSIASGTPSIARGTLVRREILELALYTFRYDNGVDNVIALMPPRNKKTQPVVVFLRRSDLASELAVPLNRTLAAKTPGVKTMTPSDVQVVQTTTGTHAYVSTVTRAQDGNLILVLTHIHA